MQANSWRRDRQLRTRLGFETLEQRRLLTTTTAIQSGEWDNPSIWSAGVPDNTLRAIIPPSVTVTLAGTDHAAQELVIQGTLNVAEPTGADFNSSGNVDGVDFLSWQRGDGDADGDADTDSVDLGLWHQQYGTAGSASGQTKTLTTDWIHVNSGGVFQIGTAANRYDQGEFVLTLAGTDQNADYTVETSTGTMQITDNGGFLMAAMGGQLQFFGQDKLSFTKLGQTAEVGANSIVVENVIERNFDGTTSAASDGQLNWEVGDQIVIASSSRDYSDQEVRTITAINDLGNGTTSLTLDSTLSKRHYGEIETYDSGNRSIDMRAEVALLSRNVRIQGLASQDTDSDWGDRALFNTGSTGDHRGISGHIMIMDTAGQISVEGVQLNRLGQTGTLGRYPIHWHLAGDRTGDALRDVSVTNSNNRGVTVHGTHNLLIEGVVLHDIHGHGFFMEDAVENGNTFLSNITFGIHQVGANGSSVNLNDPFIVDTHDHVGQNATRFLSSAGFWMTNPDNTWVGNISAGSEGTGFWFLFPDSAIGLSAQDPQYNNVQPDRVNLGQFDHNSSHSSPIGLNFDRGSDIEVPVGGTLKANFDGDEHRPSQEPQINYYTAYKHTTGIYHRGRTANFHQNAFADNFTGTFITFTQRITDTLYVGHSQGNANFNNIVTGHTFYDGANTLDGTHFAGYTTSNSHMFRSEFAAQRLTHFVMSDTSFENDGSGNNVSFVNPSGTLSYDVVGKGMPSVIYDSDGSFTSHVGGGAGMTVVPNNSFFYNSNDFLPTGWNAVVSDDLYAMFRMREPSNNALFRVTSPDGFVGENRPGTGQFNGTNTLMKKGDGDYTVEFPDGLGSISNGFDIKYNTLVGPTTGSTMVRFIGVAQSVTLNSVPRLQDLATLRNSNVTAFAVEGNDIWVKFFNSSNEVDFVPGTNPPLDGLQLSATEDAYIQDSSTLNNNILYAETSGSRTRTSYLKFDVPDTSGEAITGATLQLTVTQDGGNNMRIRVYEGGSNNWTETNLTPANAPSKTTLLDDITGNFVIGQTYSFDVSGAVASGQEVTFVVDSDNATSTGDAAFASSENSNTAIRPLLVVEVEDSSPSSMTLWDDIAPPGSSDGSAVSAIADPFGTGMGGIGRWITIGRPQYDNINPAGPSLDVSSYDGWDFTFSYDYYVDSTQPLTDDTIYQSVYSNTNFITVGSNATLGFWTTVTATGTIDTSGSTTINPLIIVNHKNTTETTPSLYIDNIRFIVSTSSLTAAVAEVSEPVIASTDLMGVELDGFAGAQEQPEAEPLLEPQGALMEPTRSSRISSRDTAFEVLEKSEADFSASNPSDEGHAEEEWHDEDLLEAVFA